MSVLGRENTASVGDTVDTKRLKLKDMMTRSTFIRMTSNQQNSVVLMGGKLDDDRNMPGGYSEIYGPRNYDRKLTGPLGEEIRGNQTTGFYYTTEERDKETGGYYQEVDSKYKEVKLSNSLRRPMPGIKNIDVSFKGGLKTNREATISWTCWSWDEIDLLSPHFLAHGKEVILEWGWVYNAENFQKNTKELISNLTKGKSSGKKIILENRQKLISDNDGDFDVMVGVVKNFEYTTREDGGFDCTTTLTSIGVNVIEKEGGNEAPNEIVDPTTSYNLDLQDNEAVEEFFQSNYLDKNNKFIHLNTSVSLKLLLSKIDDYLIETLFPRKPITSNDGGGVKFGNFEFTRKFLNNIRQTKIEAGVEKGKMVRRFTLDSPNKSIIQIGIKNNGASSNDLVIFDSWVRWGWFEDNILSKFLSITSEGQGSPILSLRSVEPILDEAEGLSSLDFESTRIRNSPDLETVDINSYILPGQFYPTKARLIQIKDEDVTIPGDDSTIQELKLASDKFRPFATDSSGENITRATVISKRQTATQRSGFRDLPAEDLSGLETKSAPGRFGYLRNMLINTKLIQKAFGAVLTNVRRGKLELTSTEPINIIESVTDLFRMINQAGNLNLWNFNFKSDEENDLIKIVDESTTYFDFEKNVKMNHMTKFDKKTGKVDGKPGVFFFPVWQSDSIVKRQNLTTKIPTALQLATMYGSNTNLVQEMENHATTFEATGVAAGAWYNENRDKSLEGFNIAIKNPKSAKIGQQDGDETQPITKDGGDDTVLNYLKKEEITETLSEIYTTRYEAVVKAQEEEAKLKEQERFAKLFDSSKPIPSTDFLSDEQLQELFNVDYASSETSDKRKTKILKDLAQAFGGKFKDGVVRNKFLSFINERIIGYGVSENEKIPLLIPFELELEIDGIGGIYPANSFHSTYLPQKYQESTIFQAKDVNHRVDGSGWTTTLSGIMRTTLDAVLKTNKKYSDFKTEYLNNYKGKLKQELIKDSQNKAKQLKEEDKAKNIALITSGKQIGQLFAIKTFNFISNVLYDPDAGID